MPDITARTTILELQDGPPALMRVLKSTGIFRDGDDPGLMLGQLCWLYGLNPGILLMMLQSANVTAEQPPLDVAPYQAMPLTELVAHIEQVHHASLRAGLPQVTALTAALAAGSPGDERLAALSSEVHELAAELDTHLAHEEEALFPMIRGLAAGNAATATRCGSAVGGPIACMENDHERAGQALQRMRELTTDYTAPATAGDLLQALRDLDQDLREHMYKENHVLFPRAEAAQREAGRRAAAQTA